MRYNAQLSQIVCLPGMFGGIVGGMSGGMFRGMFGECSGNCPGNVWVNYPGKRAGTNVQIPIQDLQVST